MTTMHSMVTGPIHVYAKSHISHCWSFRSKAQIVLEFNSKQTFPNLYVIRNVFPKTSKLIGLVCGALYDLSIASGLLTIQSRFWIRNVSLTLCRHLAIFFTKSQTNSKNNGCRAPKCTASRPPFSGQNTARASAAPAFYFSPCFRLSLPVLTKDFGSTL